MLSDFERIIEENLPEMVGKELKEILDKYESQKLEIEGMNNLVIQIEEELSEQKKNTKNYKDKYLELERLKLKEDSINEREADLENEILKKEVQSLKESRDAIFDLTKIVFKSPVYKKSITESYVRDGAPYKDEYNQTQYPRLGTDISREEINSIKEDD